MEQEKANRKADAEPDSPKYAKLTPEQENLEQPADVPIADRGLQCRLRESADIKGDLIRGIQDVPSSKTECEKEDAVQKED